MDHEFSEITQKDLPVKPWRVEALHRLPGIQPLELVDWVWVDDVFARQMAYREYLLEHRSKDVLATCSGSDDAVEELLETLLAHLPSVAGYNVHKDGVLRPDGKFVPTGRWGAMETIGRLGQQDFCVLTKVDDEHVLQAAVLCFPASWCLGQKIGKPLGVIHIPVERYDTMQAKKVQKMFDLMRPEQPLWRANCLVYSDADLFQPRREENKRKLQGDQRWVRVERQTLRKLPKTGAVVFGIHTSLVRMSTLSAEDALAFG